MTKNSKQAKPAFLKTFSEFTVAELRAMPLHRVLSLFRQEVTSTFTERKPVVVSKKKLKSEKKKVILGTPKRTHGINGFIAAMKRVFTIHAAVNTQVVLKTDKAQKNEIRHVKPVKEKQKPKQEETVVFSSQTTHEETQINNMI